MDEGEDGGCEMFSKLDGDKRVRGIRTDAN